MEKRYLYVLSLFLTLFLLNFAKSTEILDSLHLNIQTTNSSGNVITGTFNFIFNISRNSECSDIVYSNAATLTTDTRGIISYYLPNTRLNYSEQYWLCYYRDGVLIDTTRISRVPYSFSAQNVSLSGVNIDVNLNMSDKNITSTGTGFFSWLGSLVSRIQKLFVQDIDFNGLINGTGNITTTGIINGTTVFSGNYNLTNAYLYVTNGTFYPYSNPLSFYNSTTLQNISQLNNNLRYYNATSLQNVS